MGSYFQPASSSQASFRLMCFTSTGLSHLLQLYPFSSHQRCFGSKFFRQMGVLVHADKNWKNMNWSFSLPDKFTSSRMPKTLKCHSKMAASIEELFLLLFSVVEHWLVIHNHLSLCEHLIHSNIVIWCFKEVEWTISLLSLTLCWAVNYYMALKWQGNILAHTKSFLLYIVISSLHRTGEYRERKDKTKLN